MLIELAFLILLKRDLFGDSDGEDEVLEIDKMEIDIEENQVREVKETTPDDIYYYRAEEVSEDAERVSDSSPPEETVLEVKTQSDELIEDEEEEVEDHLTL